jgi:hypothetical protein
MAEVIYGRICPFFSSLLGIVILGVLFGWIRKASECDQTEAQFSSPPVWLQKFEKLAVPWLNNGDHLGALQTCAQELSGSGYGGMQRLNAALNSKFDFTRHRLIDEFLVPAADGTSHEATVTDPARNYATLL